MYLGFIDLEKAYYRVNWEALWQVLRMGGKLLSGIKSMYVDSSGSVIMKGGQSERIRIDSRVRQGCIMSPLLFNVYIGGVMKEVKMGMGRRGVTFLEDERESGDDLVLCGELEEDLGVMMGWFAEVCRRRGLKVNAGKSKVMLLNGK